MRAGQVLQDLLAPWLARLDIRLVRRLLGALDALMASCQLVLMEVARQYPGAMCVAAPLKALDRLLSNPRVQRMRQALYGAALARFWPVTPSILYQMERSMLKNYKKLHSEFRGAVAP